MRGPHLRNLVIILAAGVGLGGCATYSPYGYGSGVSVGVGNGYGYNDPYYRGYSPYGSRYGSRYGSGYGYGYSPYGWYDGYYYPGSGHYVYDRYRNPYYWSDGHRRYWTVRQRDPSVREVWTDFVREHSKPGASATGTKSSLESATRSRVEQRIRTNRSERQVERGSDSNSSVTDRIRSRIARARPKQQD